MFKCIRAQLLVPHRNGGRLHVQLHSNAVLLCPTGTVGVFMFKCIRTQLLVSHRYGGKLCSPLRHHLPDTIKERIFQRTQFHIDIIIDHHAASANCADLL